MMSQNLEEFDPTKFVRGLSEAHLEVLAEFENEAHVNLRALARSGKKHKEPTATQFLQIFTAAPAELAKKKVEPKYRNTLQEWRVELASEVPAHEKKLDRLPNVMTLSEVESMLEHSKDHERNHLMFRVLYATGIRRAELTKLVVGDINFEARRIFVRAGKGDKDRYVLLDQVTTDMLAEYTDGFPWTGQIFDISEKTVTRAVKKVGEELGILQRFKSMGRKFGAHAFRHAYATHLYDSGMDPFELQQLLGHTFLSTTLIYTHTSIERIRETYDHGHPLSTGKI